ncbi:glutathione S-transferase C-terminal domain-containing protein [Streptomyces sp. NBC_01304]|uniref:glutathione S-transferase C-terminal domain-containing protein n=1 Tax=Streptomyces sp. NBC_01304 TaxID=2903818 RepID=UPI002E12E4F9|nr:glutathione S-transferase C-terminal domain-containing protein [Streptomyces sp. NBC_01304]
MPAAAPTTTPPVPSPPSFRGRISCDPNSGYHATPRRYRLHLSLSCPHCLRIAITHSLLALDETLPVVLLPAVPDLSDGGHSALHPLYEASSHRYPGPAVAPVLSDSWTGRIVSTHTPDILSDLAGRFGGVCSDRPVLHPRGAEAEFDAVDHLCTSLIGEAAQRAGQADIDATARYTALVSLLRALGSLEWRLARQDFVVGDEMTAADVQLWVTLVQLDTVHRLHLDASAVQRIADHPHVWSYARRLAAHPAFGAHLDLAGIARRHHARCRGLEAAGAAVQILDWASHITDGAATPSRNSAQPHQALRLGSSNCA